MTTIAKSGDRIAADTAPATVLDPQERCQPRFSVSGSRSVTRLTDGGRLAGQAFSRRHAWIMSDRPYSADVVGVRVNSGPRLTGGFRKSRRQGRQPSSGVGRSGTSSGPQCTRKKRYDSWWLHRSASRPYSPARRIRGTDCAVAGIELHRVDGCRPLAAGRSLRGGKRRRPWRHDTFRCGGQNSARSPLKPLQA